MDRQISIIKDNTLLVKLTFDYSSQTTARVHITANRIEYVEGLPITIPYYIVETSAEHAVLESLLDIQEFDRTFVSQLDLPDFSADDKTMGFIYDNMHYRYVIQRGNSVVGIADVLSDFVENKKEMIFVSGSHIAGDTSVPSTSIEANITLMERFVKPMGVEGADFLLVNRILLNK